MIRIPSQITDRDDDESPPTRCQSTAQVRRDCTTTTSQRSSPEQQSGTGSAGGGRLAKDVLEPHCGRDQKPARVAVTALGDSALGTAISSLRQSGRATTRLWLPPHRARHRLQIQKTVAN
jgi:hypothetical protein